MPSPRPSRGMSAALIERQTPWGTCAEHVRRLPFDRGALDGLAEAVPVLWGPDTPVRPLGQLLFADIETMHLGGAGTIAFLVGTARIEDDAVVLRQYLACHPGEEAALLSALCADADLGAAPLAGRLLARDFAGRPRDAEHARLQGGQAAVG